MVVDKMMDMPMLITFETKIHSPTNDIYNIYVPHHVLKTHPIIMQLYKNKQKIVVTIEVWQNEWWKEVDE